MRMKATKSNQQPDHAPSIAVLRADPSPAHMRPQELPVWAQAALPLQASLQINAPGDRYEQEADRIAEQVMQMPEPRVQHKPCACGRPAGPDGMCQECKRKQLGIQRMTIKTVPQTNVRSSALRLQRSPRDFSGFDTSTAGLHEQLTDQYVASTGVKKQPGLQYTEGYQSWLSGQVSKYQFLPPTITRQNPLDRLVGGRILNHTILIINGSKIPPGQSMGALVGQYQRAITPATVVSQPEAAGVSCRFGDDFQIQSSAEIIVHTAPGPRGWQRTLSPNQALDPTDQPRCAGTITVPVILRGQPSDERYAQAIEDGEMEHARALEMLHNKHFVPYYHFVRNLQATGPSARPGQNGG